LTVQASKERLDAAAGHAQNMITGAAACGGRGDRDFSSRLPDPTDAPQKNNNPVN